MHFVRLSVIMLLLSFMHAPRLSSIRSRRFFFLDTIACHENADRPSIFIEHLINVITEHVNDAFGLARPKARAQFECSAQFWHEMMSMDISS